jgi:hypothetical protein
MCFFGKVFHLRGNEVNSHSKGNYYDAMLLSIFCYYTTAAFAVFSVVGGVGVAVAVVIRIVVGLYFRHTFDTEGLLYLAW